MDITKALDTLIENIKNDIATLSRRVSNLEVSESSASSGAPASATYITQTPDAGLSAEQALSALSTGVLKNTTGTGVLSIATPAVDYSIPGHAHSAADITSGTLALSRGGTGSNLSGSGPGFLKQTGVGVAVSVAAIAESDVTNLVADLAGKASLSHTHAESDITGLVTDLNDVKFLSWRGS